MGKVRDEAPAIKATKPAPKGAVARRSGWMRPFFANLATGEPFKPTQGWYARLWTALALAAVVLAGLYSFYQSQLADLDNPAVRLGIPAALAAVLGWFVFRLVHYPPFAEFLIATEAEMNKVSWTTWPELKRATLVVITTVVLMAFYLLGVDLIWQTLLKLIGVLHFTSTDFGSQVG